MNELQAFLIKFPHMTNDLASICHVNPSRIRQLVKPLHQKGMAVKLHDKWRFSQEAVKAVQNRDTELIPFL